LNTADQVNPLGNKLLSRLSRDDFELLRPHLAVAMIAQGVVLAEPGDEIERVIFPITGMISLVVVMKDGRAIETATVGRDSVFGASSAFGIYKSKVRALVQMPIVAASMTSVQFRRAASNSKAIDHLCIDSNEMLLTQARVTAACNALHTVEARFCRWLLQTREVSGSNTITLTQEFLSEMLGVRRTSVSEVASKLQGAGIISYARGIIRITDLAALEQRSCECLDTLREQEAL
jgi:CRP-like cAMP-binding protein